MPRCARIRGKPVLIKVSEETRAELARLKRGCENYDQVIRRLISYCRGGRVFEV